ncbi:hypothetical protein D3C80_1058550 [compost metagenome]
MHQAGVVGDHGAGTGHQVDGFGQAGFAGQVHHFFTQAGDQPHADVLATGMVVLRAEQPDLPAGANLHLGHLGIVLGGPALGLAELGPRAQGQHGTVQIQAELGQGRIPAGRVDLQCGPRIGFGQLGAGFKGQRHETLDHQRIARFVEAADVVEQAVAHLPLPAGALGDAGEIGHQRRLQGIGQEDGLVVLPIQGLADLASGGDIQHAMAKREAQRLAHFRHAFEDGPAPVGRQHVDLAVGMAGFQALEKCLRHHHVADPGGSYDQNVHKGQLQASSDKPQATSGGDHLQLAACRVQLSRFT